MENGGYGVLCVVREIDDILTAMRFLIRACELRRFHDEAHALELSLELLLRRRNYILNVTSEVSTPHYDQFPCENCYMTYSSVFLMAWLDSVLKLVSTPKSSGAGTTPVFGTSLCKRTCTLYFGTPARTDHLVEGVLYPMGLPYVSGPKDPPPSTDRLFGEHDEFTYVRKTVDFLLRTFRSSEVDTAYATLAERVADLLRTRRHFGFDMDCVKDVGVDRCRSRLADTLKQHDTRLLLHDVIEDGGSEPRSSGSGEGTSSCPLNADP